MTVAATILFVSGAAIHPVQASAPPPRASTSAHAPSLHQRSNAISQTISMSSAGRPAREIFGFALASSLSDPTVGYPSWRFDLLSTVAFFGLHVATDGQFVGDNGWTVWNSSALTTMVGLAHQHGTSVVLTIILQDFSPNTPSMCAGLAHADTTVAETIREAAAKGVDGVNIDYEGLDGGCGSADPFWAQHAFTGFAQKMRAALWSSAYLSIDTYSGSAGDGYGFFDIPGLSAFADSFFVMAYDMEYSNYSRPPVSCSGFCLGPTSPLTAYYYNDTDVMAAYKSIVPASKVILGVPYYGRKACVANAGTPNEYPTSSVVADSYLDASTEFSYYEVQPGSYVAHRESRSAGGERWDTWVNTTLNCVRELYWDDVVSLGKKYDLVNADGLRGVGLWNLNYGGGAPELWAALATHFIGCATMAVAVSPSSPQVAGTQVQLTATSTGCPNPRYAFWVMAPGASDWQLARAYSPAATFQWNTTGGQSGGYRFSAWARDAASAGAVNSDLGSFDAYSQFAFKLTPPCAPLGASPAPAAPARVGTPVTITATASTCPNPLYQFWVMAPGTSNWQVAQAYSTNATLHWSTAGRPGGGYRFSIWARDAASPGTSTYDLGSLDSLVQFTYVLVAPCASVAVLTSPSSPSLAGTRVTITATASTCPNPLYQFWVMAPGTSDWQLAQAYSTNATLSWSTTGRPGGGYRFSVWARDAASGGLSLYVLGSLDAYVQFTYSVISPCASVSASSSPPPPATTGTPVTITATASGCPNPLYEFWVMAPGTSNWQLAQPYSTNATLSWSTRRPAGGYRFSIWVRDAASAGTSTYDLGSLDSYIQFVYTLK